MKFLTSFQNLQKICEVKSLSNYKKESNYLKKIKKYLIDLEIQFEEIDMNYADGLHPAIYLVYPHEKRDFDVIIRAEITDDLGDYFQLYCPLYNTDPLDIKIANKLFRKCLELNFFLPETKIVLDSRNYLYIKAEMPVSLSLDEFNFELDGIDLGIENFVPKLESLGLRLPTSGSLKDYFSK